MDPDSYYPLVLPKANPGGMKVVPPEYERSGTRKFFAEAWNLTAMENGRIQHLKAFLKELQN
jgi:hypothetical protein